MSSIVIAGDTSGTVTLDAPAVAGSTVLTLPATSGTLNTSGAVNVVPAGTAAAPAITTTGDTNTGIFFPAADTIAFAEGGAEHMRIDSSGNLLVGTTGTGAGVGNTNSGVGVEGVGTVTVSRDDNIAMYVNTNGNRTLISCRRSGNEVGRISVTTTATAYNTSSDYRLKEDVQPMEGALDVVSALNPVTYKWKSNGSDGQGFIAHELQEVIPDCVTGEKDAVDAEGNPQYQGVDTSFLVATLTAAIQEQQAVITDLKERIEALEGASV